MAIEKERWGIVYCPKAGSRRTHKRWENIRGYLEEKEVLYDFIHSENESSVERLIGMLVQNGYKTIILVGGDGALNDALNGLIDSAGDKLNTISFGIIPNGIGNDFAHFWGYDEGDYRYAIDQLIRKRIRKIDVGSCTFELDGERRTRYFVNCVNIGVVANIMNIKYNTQKFWGTRWLSTIFSSFPLLFQRMHHKIRIKIGNEMVEKSAMNVCVGNARGYGLTPSAVPYNGLLDVSIAVQHATTQLLEAIWLLYWGRFLNNKRVYPYRTRQITLHESGKAMISMDGRVVAKLATPIEITVQQEMLNFIIPSSKIN